MKKLTQTIKLKEDESVSYVLRHSFVIVIPHLILAVLVILLDFFFMLLLFSLGWWGTVIFAVILFLSVFYLFRILFLWNNNIIVITSERIVDMERSGFFDQLISEFSYKEIKNVSGQIKGFWQTIFRYGDIKMVLENRSKQFELYNLGRPFKVLESININLNKLKKADQDVQAEQDKESGGLTTSLSNKIESLSNDDKKELIAQLEEDLEA